MFLYLVRVWDFLFVLFIYWEGEGGLELQFPPITKTSRQAASPLPPFRLSSQVTPPTARFPPPTKAGQRRASLLAPPLPAALPGEELGGAAAAAMEPEPRERSRRAAA